MIAELGSESGGDTGSAGTACFDMLNRRRNQGSSFEHMRNTKQEKEFTTKKTLQFKKTLLTTNKLTIGSSDERYCLLIIARLDDIG